MARAAGMTDQEETMTQPPAFCPDGARLAVSVSMQFEAGGQPVSGAGGPITEPILDGFPDLEALGGRISLHSPPGAGTTLQIALPLSGPTRPAWES
jgi:hypothetical protein